MNSAFYLGSVFHKRTAPKVHQFTYPLYMTFLDLDEVDDLHIKHWWFSSKRWAPLQFKASDYFKSISTENNCTSAVSDHPITSDYANNATSLKQRAISIAQTLGANSDKLDRVCMLTQLRCFGLYFSPVNFFFLYEGNDARYTLAEVSNTPWNKKHCYLIDLCNPKATPKAFHVSPFMDLDMVYQWTIRPPQEKTHIRIENWNKKTLFTAIFSAERYEITPKNTRKVFLQWPAVTLSIIKGIYWQAAKLFMKGIPYIPYQVEKTGQAKQTNISTKKRTSQ